MEISVHDSALPGVRLRLGEPARRVWEPRVRGLVGTLLFLLPIAGGAQGACGTVRLEPPSPRPGKFFRVRVGGTGFIRPVGGVAFGEPLHFAADTGQEWVALAGAPVEATGTATVRVVCDGEAGRDSVTAEASLARAVYPSERLQVNREFVDRPDSALAARIAGESARALAVARGSHATPRLWRDPFQRPRASRVTSGYGRARMFNGTVQSRHLGTDFAGAVGAPVRAVNRGVVRVVAAFYYGGRVVYIDHGEGITSAYLHLSRHRVAEGDTVTRGQVIGEVGATGRVTGPHLHLIARYGRLNLDPLSLLDHTRSPAATR